MVTAGASEAVAAAAGFPTIGSPTSVELVTRGHIHDTWVVTGAGGRFVLQRCNAGVFADLDAVMANIALVLSALDSPLRLLPCAAGGPLWRPGDGSAWRAFPFLEDTVPGAPVTTAERAAELGRAFGEFHRRTASLDPDRLAVTIPGFHDPPARLVSLEQAAARDRLGRRAGATAELAGLAAWRGLALRVASMQPPAVPTRVAHFDAKADNVLLDRRSGRARAVIDLDTVMPGSVLWDVGDLARSAVGPAAEDETDLGAVGCDVARWAALLDGYLTETGPLLTGSERAALAVAPLVVTFEQAVRFLTDYLDGDRYYRVERPEHNLDRCRCQLALVQSMAARESDMIAAL